MNRVDFPQASGTIGLAWRDITPPVGIYHRMWGAATHERATGVHRPLRVTVFYAQPSAPADGRFVVALDHCLLEAQECRRIADAVARATRRSPSQVSVACSHTHAAGLMTRSRSELPGGDLIGPYLDDVAHAAAQTARTALDQCEPASLLFGAGQCSLATHRDYYDAPRRGYVCGYNPDGPADDALLIAKIVSATGRCLGTIVNYACHPTTLAWENTLISPDYVGACRETIEAATSAPCLFLQGASGDLGPRVGFVGDPGVADSNGRQLGYAALAALEALAPAGTCYAYTGAVVSGATVGTWRFEPLSREELRQHAIWRTNECRVDLSYREDLESIAACEKRRADWQRQERDAEARRDAPSLRDCHAEVERCTRQIHRLRQLPPGRNFPFPVKIWRWGDSIWVFVGGEHYQSLQVELRRRFPQFAIVVATLTDDWLPGYVPPASIYGAGIYQETIALVAPGSGEFLLESISRVIADLSDSPGYEVV